MKVRVSNMKSLSGRSDRTVPNQFIIYTPDGMYFQSYDSVIAFIPTAPFSHQLRDVQRKIILDANCWDYSTTTGKYRNKFLGETKDETQKKIDSGYYELADLNNN